jgi:DNA-binding transcriptional LysR family regulator
MNRKIYLTEDGKVLLQYVGAILSQYRESLRVIREDDDFRECRIGVNVSIGETRMAGIAAAVKKQFPEVRMTILIENTEQIERRLAENTLDLAIVDSLSLDGSFHRQLLSAEVMEAVASPSLQLPERISLKKLAAQDLLLRETGSAGREVVEMVFRQNGLLLRPTVESASSLALLSLAEQGLGVSILPAALTARSASEGRLMRLQVEHISFERSYYLVYHRNKYLSEAMKGIIALIRKTEEAPSGSC